MFRFLSLLLILVGLGALAFGGYQYLQPEPDRKSVAASPSGSIGFDSGPESESGALDGFGMPDLPSDATSSDDEFFGVASVGGDVMNALRTVPIAHETPSSAQFGREFTVTLAVDATGDDTAADALSGRGNVVEGEAQISSSMTALVSGDTFEVRAITPETQLISPVTENVWRWKVTPTAVGSQELVVELFANLDGQALPLRTFRDEIEVDVSRVGQAIAIAKSVSPITVVAGGIGSLLAGLFGFIGFFRRR
nr:hypothetical protein [Hyphomonas sp. Mor2]